MNDYEEKAKQDIMKLLHPELWISRKAIIEELQTQHAHGDLHDALVQLTREDDEIRHRKAENSFREHEYQIISKEE